MTRISALPGKPLQPSPVNRYLRVEAYYQQAARTAGTTVQASLDATLKNSAVCTAIAGNATARSIMSTRYASSMASYVASSFSDGLNYLNYLCGIKCYLTKAGNLCTNITGGYERYSNYHWTLSFSSTGGALQIVLNSYGAVFAKNKINMSRFKTMGISGSGFSPHYGCLAARSKPGYDNGSDDLAAASFSSSTSGVVSIASLTSDTYVGVNDWGSGNTYNITEIYLQ